LALIFGVLTELNSQNQTFFYLQASPSTVVLQKHLAQVHAIQLLRSSEEDDSNDDDKATEKSISVVPDSQPPTPQTTARVYANLWSVLSSNEKLAPLQT